MRGAFRRWYWIAGTVVVILTVSGLIVSRRTLYRPVKWFRDAIPVSVAPVHDLQSEVDRQLLQNHVFFLASPDLKGRENGSPEGELAVEFVRQEFLTYGLRPGFNDSYRQRIETGSGVNVGGLLQGSDVQLREELIVVAAHHDHLGIIDGQIHPGADDNASGVAVLIEVARILAAHPDRIKRSILFLSFDAEERPDFLTDRMGSAFYVNRMSEAERNRIVLMINMDLLGGNLFPNATELVFILGAEKSPEVASLVKGTSPPTGLRAIPTGLAMVEAVPFLPPIERAVSDYAVFRNEDIPVIFLSTGRTTLYHTPHDTAGALDYEKMRKIAQYLIALIVGAANEASSPRFDRSAVDQYVDVGSMVTLLDLVIDRPPDRFEAGLIRRLQEDRERVGDFAKFLSRRSLSSAEYRELQLISLRLQCALARPEWFLCDWL